jgi:hypothetical protein
MKIDQIIPDDQCVQFIENHGRCDRPENHIVHKGMGISVVEHDFLAPVKGDDVETVKLSRRNVKYIARRSGKSADELEVMRQVAKKQGKKNLMLRYQVVAD